MSLNTDIVGQNKKLQENPILKKICEDVAKADSNSHLWELLNEHDLVTDAAYLASDIPALVESLLIAYEGLNLCTMQFGVEAMLTAQRTIERLHTIPLKQ